MEMMGYESSSLSIARYIRTSSSMPPNWRYNGTSSEITELDEMAVASFNGVDKIIERRLL